ncbi:glycosyltransferase [Hymenobacter sp. 15J16-1T3B]|uniref:glycosyltransferase n=1 Tax=Hymenobacter sp. 15J16-1T3B TaxID=2886941 RepID=UPI001D1123D7|nr:glycosyltransferase [Hymenobacter sp. 15J16-1T3B]MCC3160710.1 glycosyltransferase [Hymenobacter sp. 15J16-1T3B]
MSAFVSPSVLVHPGAPATLAAPLAVLSLAPAVGPAEEQLLRLCATLRTAAQSVLLVAAAASPLGPHAAARLPVPPLSGPLGLGRVPRAAWLLARWLRRQRIGTLLVVRALDLPVASAAKLLLRGRLRLVFHQHEPLAAAAPAAWWARLSRRPLDAWLAPLPGTARAVETRTGLDARQLWVVPPGLPGAAPGVTAAAPAQARRLLDLPTAAPLLGVADDGYTGHFALEVLYRLRTELQLPAELVIVGHPHTPPDAARWQQLRQHARALGLSQVVYLRPFHAPAADGLLFPALDALLSPAPTDDYDPLLLAALAAGCPVVAAEGAAAPDFPGLQHLFPARDVAFGAVQVRAVLQAGRRASAPYPQLSRYFSAAQQGRLLTDILHYLAA